MKMSSILKCPACGQNGITKLQKLKLSLFSGQAKCSECGQLLKPKGKFASVFIGAITGSVFLYVGLYSLAIESWLPIILLLFGAYFLSAIPPYILGLTYSGKKQFKLK
jgi:predicted RNA-binding Zn-ribbon protein involved in translation (DUF1610 family)